MASAQRTIDHETIQQWVESHGGKPAHVKRTGQDSDPGILRIDFPGFSGEGSLEPLDWDAWFDAFEANQLAFLYQDRRGDGGPSNFNKLVRRSPEDEEPQARPHQRGQRRKGRTTRIDLNTASEEELQALYGIGPQNARKIAEYRRSKGGIESPDELANIDGIDGHMVQIIRKELSNA
jgi:competence ComEA-like helix-hairpin-helix protein